MEGTAPPFLGTVKGDLGHSTSQALLLGHNNKKGSQSAIAVYASSLFMLHFYSELSEKFDFTYRVALHSNCNAHTYVTYVCLFVCFSIIHTQNPRDNSRIYVGSGKFCNSAEAEQVASSSRVFCFVGLFGVCWFFTLSTVFH